MRARDELTSDARTRLAIAVALVAAVVTASLLVLDVELAGIRPLGWFAVAAFVVALMVALRGWMTDAQRETRERRIADRLARAVESADRVERKASELSAGKPAGKSTWF